MIKKEGDKWVLYSHDGSKKLFSDKSKKKVEEREKEINAFKHSKSGVIYDPEYYGKIELSDCIGTISLTITKASLQEDGTMRFSAICSDTNPDRTGERTSLALFQDWIERTKTNKSVSWLPAPRMPFLGVSHYPDLNGFGEAGIIDNMYIDGDRFRVTGHFFSDDDHPLGKALFEAVWKEQKMIERGDAIKEPIRISAAWWDLAHSHGDFVFERKSLDHKCPMCNKDTNDKEYLKGQLDHQAATRVPINPRTALGLEEKSMAKTRKQDAASIVGNDLAEQLEEQAAKPTAKSETEGGGALVIKNEDETLIERMFNGAVSMDEAEAFLKAQETQEKMWTHFDMFQMVVDNIMYSDDIDKIAAIEKAIKDFGNRVMSLKANIADAVLFTPVVKGVTVMTDQNTQQTQEQPVLPQVQPAQPDNPGAALHAVIDGALKNATLGREQKAEVIQQALNVYAETVKAQLNAVAPPDPTEAIIKAFTPFFDRIEMALTRSGVPAQYSNQGQPQQKSFAPGQQPVINDPAHQQHQLPISPVTGRPSGLTALIQRSVRQ